MKLASKEPMLPGLLPLNIEELTDEPSAFSPFCWLKTPGFSVLLSRRTLWPLLYWAAPSPNTPGPDSLSSWVGCWPKPNFSLDGKAQEPLKDVDTDLTLSVPGLPFPLSFPKLNISFYPLNWPIRCSNYSASTISIYTSSWLSPDEEKPDLDFLLSCFASPGTFGVFSLAPSTSMVLF